MIEYYVSMIISGIKMEPRDLIYSIPVIIFISIASRIDLKIMKIPNKLNYTMILLRLALAVYIPIQASNILGFVIGGALILIPAMIVIKPMGGDIKFAAALGLWIGDISIFLTMILAVVMFLFYGFKIKKIDVKESLPFAPFISIGYILIIAIGLFI
ncbi:prepilin peptidase [Hungatella hathewayi]|uniref:prepilin peptidase n=1 Tax=Hungatella hathewayi TaxID=154046 RepID=UPI00356B41C0